MRLLTLALLRFCPSPLLRRLFLLRFLPTRPRCCSPAGMTVLHIPSHGVQINGLVYRPSGAGPHPTLVICHGLPGTKRISTGASSATGWLERCNVQLSRSWGSPGVFRFAQNLEDADAVLVYLRDPANAARLGVDTKRIAIADTAWAAG